MALVHHVSVPSFHTHLLIDSTPLENMAALVAQECNRPKEAARLCELINTALFHSQAFPPSSSSSSSAAPALNLHTLRSMSDQELQSLSGVPVMARVMLKYLVRQSNRGDPSTYITYASSSASSSSSSTNPFASPTNASSSSSSSSSTPFAANPLLAAYPADALNDPALKALERDFNRGQTIDLTPYSASLSLLISMGFPFVEALEALIVTDNKDADRACGHLFRESKERANIREMAKHKIGKFTPLPSPSSSTTSLTSPVASSSATPPTQVLYREFLRGAFVHEYWSKKAYEAIKNERVKRKISSVEQTLSLKEIGQTEATWEKVRKGRFVPPSSAPGSTDASAVDMDCVACLDAQKTMIMLPCAHLCLCQACADQMAVKKSKCPLCNEDIDRVLKVFM